MAMMAPRVAMRLPLLKSLVWLDWAKWGAVPGSPSVEQDTLPLDHQHHSPLTHKSTTQGVAQSASLQDKKWPRRNGDDGHQRLPLLKSLVWLNWWKQAAVHGSPAVEQNTLPLDHQHHSPLTQVYNTRSGPVYKSTRQEVAQSTSLQDKKWPRRNGNDGHQSSHETTIAKIPGMTGLGKVGCSPWISCCWAGHLTSTQPTPLTHKSTIQGVAQSTSLQDKKWPGAMAMMATRDYHC